MLLQLSIFGVANFNVEHFQPSALGSSQNRLDPEGSPLTLASHLQFLREYHCFYFRPPPFMAVLVQATVMSPTGTPTTPDLSPCFHPRPLSSVRTAASVVSSTNTSFVHASSLYRY